MQLPATLTGAALASNIEGVLGGTVGCASSTPGESWRRLFGDGRVTTAVLLALVGSSPKDDECPDE